jgi:transposase-like protein
MLEQLQVGWYQRHPDRVDQRNGFYTRSLATRLGVITNLHVPRSRQGKYQSQILPHYQRYEASVQDMVQEAFLAIVSYLFQGGSAGNVFSNSAISSAS